MILEAAYEYRDEYGAVFELHWLESCLVDRFVEGADGRNFKVTHSETYTRIEKRRCKSSDAIVQHIQHWENL